jgi:hypothetical protein
MSRRTDKKNKNDLDTSDHSERDREGGQEKRTLQTELNQGETNFIGPVKPDLDSGLEKLKNLFEQMDISKDEVCKAFIAQQVTYDSKFESLINQSIKLGNNDAWTVDSENDHNQILILETFRDALNQVAENIVNLRKDIFEQGNDTQEVKNKKGMTKSKLATQVVISNVHDTPKLTSCEPEDIRRFVEKSKTMDCQSEG